MIKQTHNINDIALVWGEAFGDSFDDIKYFEENDIKAITLDETFNLLK